MVAGYQMSLDSAQGKLSLYAWCCSFVGIAHWQRRSLLCFNTRWRCNSGVCIGGCVRLNKLQLVNETKWTLATWQPWQLKFIPEVSDIPTAALSQLIQLENRHCIAALSLPHDKTSKYISLATRSQWFHQSWTLFSGAQHFTICSHHNAGTDSQSARIPFNAFYCMTSYWNAFWVIIRSIRMRLTEM